MRYGEQTRDGGWTSATPTVGDRARAVRVAWALVRAGLVPRPGRGERFGTEWVPLPGDAHQLAVSVYVTDAETRSTVEERAQVWFLPGGYDGGTYGPKKQDGTRPYLSAWVTRGCRTWTFDL